MLIIALDFQSSTSAEATRQEWLGRLPGLLTKAVKQVSFAHWLGDAPRASDNSVPGEEWLLSKVEEHSPAYFADLVSTRY